MYFTCLFQLSKYFSVRLALYNFFANFLNKKGVVWEKNKISEIYKIEYFFCFLSLIVDIRSDFPVISSTNISHYNFVRHKNIVSGLCIESLLLVGVSNIRCCEFCLISDSKPVNFTYLKHWLAIIKSFSHFLFQ